VKIKTVYKGCFSVACASAVSFWLARLGAVCGLTLNHKRHQIFGRAKNSNEAKNIKLKFTSEVFRAEVLVSRAPSFCVKI